MCHARSRARRSSSRRAIRRYRIRGLFGNTSYQVLKVNVCVSRGDAVHVDALDMTLARQRTVFAKQASEELRIKEDVIRHDLGRMLLKLESLRDEAIKKALEPKDETVQLSPEDRAAAMELLRDPRLMDRILEDFARCGVEHRDGGSSRSSGSTRCGWGSSIE